MKSRQSRQSKQSKNSYGFDHQDSLMYSNTTSFGANELKSKNSLTRNPKKDANELD